METLKHIKIRELDDVLRQLDLSEETRVSVTIEDDIEAERTARQLRAKRALDQLRGTGTGSLVEALRKEREKDKHR